MKQKRHPVIMLVVCLLSVTMHAQTSSVDSLYNLFDQAKGEQRIVIANEIAQQVYTLECTDTLFRFSKAIDPIQFEATINELMANYAMYEKTDHQLACRFYLEAAELYKQVKDTMAMDIMYGNASVEYLRMGNYEKGIELLLTCYELEERMNDMYGLSSTLNSLGIAYSRWGQNETAITYFLRAIEVERPLNRPMQFATRLSSLAKEYSLLKDYERALSLIKEALTYDEKIERKEKEERIAVHLSVMGDIYLAMDSLPQADKCYVQAVEIFEKNRRKQLLSAVLLSQGGLYLKQNRLIKAIETLEYCVEICAEHKHLQTQLSAFKLLYQAHKQLQPYSSSALEYLEQYTALNDSLFNQTTQTQITDFQVKYDTQQKELEIVQQQAEIDKHKARQYLYIGGLIVAGILLVLFIYIVRLRTKRNRILSEANATKDKFFSIISHDLKNPAIAQRDALQQLINYSDKWDTDSLSEYYEELLKSADGQVELLYNLLNWAQVQTGRMPYTPTEFDLVTELRSDIALTKNMADRKGILWDVQMPETAIVTGDRNMLTTVVRNLLTNAVKFTAKNGHVSLEIIPEENGGYTISVNDTGTGMSREQIENLFNIDRQRSRLGTAGEQGSGLGLIVCKELIEKHGSILHVESEEGKGSRFRFVI